MISPISQLINFFPFQTAVKISLERINLISEQLKSYDGERPALRQFHSAPFVSVRFEDVRFDYFDQNDVSFRLSVPDVTIKQGEIVFLTGGNGSGKSTFINILTGLYKPAAGKIYLNGDEIDWGEYISFSNQMAVVFTNHHLFGDNYDEHDFTSNESLFEYYREMLNLSEILKLDPARNFVDTDLSKGQQKRLALLLALMEDKPLIILDEWAAEQDPVNRKYFYTKWLTAMKDMGKTVIAITHDDDYFHTADRVIRFDYGRITSDGVLVN